MTPFTEVTPVVSNVAYLSGTPTFAATADGFRSSEPGKVLALPNGGEHRIGPPDYVLYATGGQCAIVGSPYGYSYGCSGTAVSQAGGGEADRDRPRRLPGPVVEDSPGCNQRPDPMVEATDAASLIRTLNRWRAYTGDRSFREMERECGRLRSASTLHRVLTGDKMPSQDEVKAVVRGCGGNEEDVSRYVSAWRKIRMTDPVPVPRALTLAASRKAS